MGWVVATCMEGGARGDCVFRVSEGRGRGVGGAWEGRGRA